MITNIVEFNRLLNIATHYRTLKSGKKIKVSGHRRTYERLKSALQDLANQSDSNSREYGYLMNPKTGIVSQRSKGETSVVDFDEILKQPNINPDNLSRYILHNHPSRTSLSIGDLLNSKNSFVFNINNTGSIFRGKLLDDSPDNLQYMQYLYNSGKEIKQNLHKRIYSKFRSRLDDYELGFLITHGRNKNLSNLGIIKYKATLSTQDSQLYKKHQSIVDSYFSTLYSDF